MVSIMPGIESRAPERTDTKAAGSLMSPNFLPVMVSRGAVTPSCICPCRLAGIGALVGVVVGADLGGDREAGGHRQADAWHISARLAPLPPSSFIGALPSRLLAEVVDVFAGGDGGGLGRHRGQRVLRSGRHGGGDLPGGRLRHCLDRPVR